VARHSSVNFDDVALHRYNAHAKRMEDDKVCTQWCSSINCAPVPALGNLPIAKQGSSAGTTQRAGRRRALPRRAHQYIQAKEIAKNTAAEHGFRVTDIVLAPSIASTGEPALEIKARASRPADWDVDSEATVALMDGLFAALKANPGLSHAEALRSSMLRMIGNRSKPEWAEPFFWAPKGRRYPITLEALTTRWQRDRAKAAVRMPSVADIRWHDLRGTFGSRLLRKTRNLAWVKEALGHASINTTMRHYAHVPNDDVRGAKAEVQCADVASPALQKLQGKLQGRPNLKVVG
jgi:integrase